MARRMEEHSEVAGLPPGSLEDKDLTLAFQGGDKGAYQAIYDRYSARVHNVCRRMLGNPQDAQEAAQESFLRVYQALGRFNGRYQLGAWITRITTNVCLDQLRARARRPADVAELDVVDLDDDRHHDPEGPEFLIIRRAESHRVHKVLADLPPMHRAAIVLRDFEGLSYAEVAIALGMSECQVKALIHRARQNFKRSWTPLSLLMPWRLLGRVKEVDASARDHVSQVVATSVQVAPTCTSAFQQCGQYVAERVAPIFTAAVMGAAVGGAAVAKSSRPVAKERTQVASEERLSYRAGSSSVLASSERPTKSEIGARGTEEPEAPAPEKVVAPPSPQPSPSQPSEAPVAEPTPTPSPTPTDSPKPTKPVREPFAAALGFEGASTPPTVQPSSNKTWVDCDPTAIRQRLGTTFSHGSESYPAHLSLVADASSLSLQLSIWKAGTEIYYTGEGSLSGGSRTGSDLLLEFTGSYRTGNQEARDSAGLPINGTFVLQVTLDCAWDEMTSESLTFSD